MTALEKAMQAARSVTELFGRDEEVVRAVLMAVRDFEPGSVVWDAIFDRLDDGKLCEDYGVADVWQAGIDAILNKEPK